MQCFIVPIRTYELYGYKKSVDFNRGFIHFIRGGIGYTLTLKGKYYLLTKFDYLNRKTLELDCSDLKKFGVCK